MSSALLALVLAVVGGVADRLERRRVLAALAAVPAIALAALAAVSLAAPRLAAIATMIGGKQLAAATDLAFWVVIAERVDARRSRRVVPVLAATGGLGAAVGAALVVPLVAVAGPRGVLAAAAALLVIAGLAAARLPATRRGLAAGTGVAAPRAGALIARSWRDGARAVRRHPLARHLAVVVAIAGVFASLAYFALGVAVTADGRDVAELAATLAIVRGAGQLITVVVQVTVAPRLLARLGTGHALLVAPLVALAAGLGLVIAPILAVAIATQLAARTLDAAVETPAEKLAQALLPTAVRGRVAGFLDGTAKRAGAVLGGVAAAVLVGAPAALYAVTAIAAACWLVAAARVAASCRRSRSRTRSTIRASRPPPTRSPTRARSTRWCASSTARAPGARPRCWRGCTSAGARTRSRRSWPRVSSAGRAAVRALVAVLDAPREAHGPALLARARSRPASATRGARGRPGRRRAAGELGAHEAGDPALALVARVAARRLAGGADAVLAELADAVRDPARSAAPRPTS